MRNGVAIAYGDIAPEAKENFTPTASEKESFVNLSDLQQYNMVFENYANPCELYQTVLDGSMKPLKENPTNMGLWSVQISDENGSFETPITLTLTSEGQYSSLGLTLKFDEYNNIFCNSLNIKWYRDNEIISNMDFTPDNPSYFCDNKVDNYNGLLITFKSINMPYNRLKLRVIDYGYGTIFYGEELRGVKVIQEINPIATDLSINTCDFTLDSKTDNEYSFQKKQALKIFFNQKLIMYTFVSSSKRKAKRLWEIQTEDYIGLMDYIPFYGGIYNDKNAGELVNEIFAKAKIPYTMTEELKSKTVTGYIPICSCREALLQVLIAIGAVLNTAGVESVEIFTLSDEVKQKILLNRVMLGQNFTNDETVTGVKVAYHSYTPIEDSMTVYTAKENGTGENILVQFSEPLHDLDMTGGDILESGANYAIINAREYCSLSGKKYKHSTFTKQKNNPVVLASEIEKIVTVDTATLISLSNIDNVLNACYNYLSKVDFTNMQIVEGKHVEYNGLIKWGTFKWGTRKWGEELPPTITYDMPVNLGDVITTETQYLGDITGRIISQRYNLNGNIIVKEVELVQ